MALQTYLVFTVGHRHPGEIGWRADGRPERVNTC